MCSTIREVGARCLADGVAWRRGRMAPDLPSAIVGAHGAQAPTGRLRVGRRHPLVGERREVEECERTGETRGQHERVVRGRHDLLLRCVPVSGKAAGGEPHGVCLFSLRASTSRLRLLGDASRFLCFCRRPNPALAAENLFLRKQLALYQERHVTPQQTTQATRMALTWLARWFDRRQALVIVQPVTLISWHRQGFRLSWRWTSKPGRPPIPADLQGLIRRMAREIPMWDEERIANELLLKFG
jgi:hypothetical protein